MTRAMCMAAVALGFGSFALGVAACDSSSNSSPAGADGGVDATVFGTAGIAYAGVRDASSVSPSCTPFDASGLDEASVVAGFAAAWTYRCWACHQPASMPVTDGGSGMVLSGNNDWLGSAGTMYPPNLTNDPTGIGCSTDDQVETAILLAMGPDAGPYCGMPAFGKALELPDGAPRPGTPMDAGTAAEIVAFLRSLPPVSNQVPATICAIHLEAGVADEAGPAQQQ